MELELEQTNSAIIVSVKNGIQIDSAMRLRDFTLSAATTHSPRAVLMNFAAVNYIDSVGLGTLLSIYKTVKNKNMGFALFAIPKEIESLFELTQLNKIIPILKDREAALAHAGEANP